MSLEDLGIKVRKGSPLDPHGTRDLERAVIEAAEALYQAERMPGVETYFAVHAAKQVFNKAVEALQEVEGE